MNSIKRILAYRPLNIATAALLLSGFGAHAVTYKTIHGFAGAPSEPGTPVYGSSLIASGSTLYGMTQTGGNRTNGALFKISTSGSGIHIIHNFDGHTIINTAGSTEDGALPYGTPLLVGSTLYGLTTQGGSNSFGLGTAFKVNTDGGGFQMLHHFGGAHDGYYPAGSLIVSDSTLYGMTSQGGSNSLDLGIIFKMDTNGGNYQILHSFAAANDGGIPQGSLVLSGTTLYGMTGNAGTLGVGTAFRIETNGTGYQTIHNFTGVTTDGSSPQGSLIVSGTTLYGMTLHGGANNVGTVFEMQTNGLGFLIRHSFALNEAYNPYGDVALSGSTLYGITHSGKTNIFNSSLGFGSVFQVNTDGSGYQVLHTFLYPINNTDGTFPFGSPLLLGSTLYGMTSLGGGPHNAGCIFSLTVDAPPPVMATLSVATSGGGSVTPSLDGQSLQIGTTYKLTAKPGTGSRFVNWTSNLGGTLTTNAALSFVMQSNLVLTAHFVDGALPSLVVSSPKPGLRVSNELFTVTGTAKDNVALAGVYCQLNGGDWTPAATSNNWANWTAPFTLLPGTNILSAYALDTALNSSATNTLKFIYVLSAPLAIQIVGQGTVTPNYDGKLLAISNSYTVTAKASKGFAFQNWTGDLPANTARLTFVMRSNLVLVANFVDISRPVNVITVPAVNKTVTNTPFTAAGKAKDNVAVSNVWYQLNGTGWNAAGTANSFSNWTAPDLMLPAGANLLQAFASDGAGNNSLTNSVKFTYKVVPVTDWAPDSLNGLLLQVQPSNGFPEHVTFDIASFAQAGLTGDTNEDDYTLGAYEYVKMATNLAQLSFTNTAPPSQTNGGPSVIQLVFTNHYAAIFTNEDGESGALSASVVGAIVPATLAGKTLVAKPAGSGLITTVVLAKSGGTFTKTPSNTGAPGPSTGAAAFTRYSPTTGLLALAFTGADAGATSFVQLTFTSATAGAYFVSSFDNTGALTDTESGAFALK